MLHTLSTALRKTTVDAILLLFPSKQAHYLEASLQHQHARAVKLKKYLPVCPHERGMVQ